MFLSKFGCVNHSQSHHHIKNGSSNGGSFDDKTITGKILLWKSETKRPSYSNENMLERKLFDCFCCTVLCVGPVCDAELRVD